MAAETPRRSQTAPAAPKSQPTRNAPAEEARFPGSRWLIGSYLLLSLFFFLPALGSGVMLFGTDYIANSYPFEAFVTEQFRSGRLPSWLPHVYGGVPYFSNPMDIYYPVTLLLRLLHVPTHDHIALLFVVQTFLAGTGMYLLLRELGCRHLAAYLGGLLYMFSGYLISFIYGGHDGRAIVATLAPLFLFAQHRAVRTNRLRWYLLAGAVLGSALLSNQIQSAYYLLLAGGLWFLFLIWHLEAYRPASALLRRLGGAALALGVGFAMAAINFLPFLGFVDESARGGPGRGYDYATSWAAPPEEIVGLAVPERIGMLDAYWGDNPLKYHTEYVGALALVLVLVGVYLLRRSPYLWFFAALSVLALTLSFGGYTPAYRLYYALLPGTPKFRAPSISFYLLTLSLVAVAGLALERLAVLRTERLSRSAERSRGADAALRTAQMLALGALAVVVLWGAAAAATAPPPLTTTPTTREAYVAAQAAANHPAYVGGIWRFAAFLVLSLGGLWLWVRGKVTHRVAAVLLGLVVVADLWVIGKRFFEVYPEPADSFAPDQVVHFLNGQPKPFRLFVLQGLPQDDYPMVHGIELVTGEHAAALRSYLEFLGEGAQTYTDLHNLNNPVFLALTNAQFLLSPGQLSVPFLTPVFQGPTRSGQQAVVYLNQTALPRAFLVPSGRRVPEPEGAIQAMQADGFDPSREVLLYADPPLAARPGAVSAPGSARIVRHEPAEVEVEIEAVDSAYLVLLDNYYDGWRARVGAVETPVLRAYHTFRAVVIPPGRHRVTFTFDPPALRAGLIVSASVGAALIGYALALLLGWWRHRARA